MTDFGDFFLSLVKAKEAVYVILPKVKYSEIFFFLRWLLPIDCNIALWIIFFSKFGTRKKFFENNTWLTYEFYYMFAGFQKLQFCSGFNKKKSGSPTGLSWTSKEARKLYPKLVKVFWVLSILHGEKDDLERQGETIVGDYKRGFDQFIRSYIIKCAKPISSVFLFKYFAE